MIVVRIKRKRSFFYAKVYSRKVSKGVVVFKVSKRLFRSIASLKFFYGVYK